MAKETVILVEITIPHLDQRQVEDSLDHGSFREFLEHYDWHSEVISMFDREKEIK